MRKKKEQLTEEPVVKGKGRQKKGTQTAISQHEASAEQTKEGGAGKQEFRDFNPFEYSLFWVLQLIIIFCVIELFGGDLEKSLQVFFEVINPLNWK